MSPATPKRRKRSLAAGDRRELGLSPVPSLRHPMRNEIDFVVAYRYRIDGTRYPRRSPKDRIPFLVMAGFDTPVKEFLTRAEGQLVSESDSVAEAAVMLANLGSGCVLVEKDGRLTGIFTERDFLVRVAAQARDSNALEVREVMTSDPECVEEWAPVAYAVNRMAIGGYRNIPVVTRDGKPLGVVTVFDVVDYLMQIFKELPSSGAEQGEGEGDWLDIGGG